MTLCRQVLEVEAHNEHHFRIYARRKIQTGVKRSDVLTLHVLLAYLG